MVGETTGVQAPVRARLAPPAVVLDDVSVTYRVYEDRKPTLHRLVANRFKPRTYRAIEALREISLVVRRGDAIGVLGRNGSGKSTLLRTIAGLLPPVAGSVHVTATPVLLGVAAALQPGLSGRQNVFLGGTALGLRKRELERRFDEIIAFAGLEEFADIPLRAYSSGMAARLQFAIASAVQPDVLLIDEALAVGDREFKQRSSERIQELLSSTGTVFLVSHSLSTITDLCTRAIWLDRGHLLMDGPPDEVTAAYTAATAG